MGSFYFGYVGRVFINENLYLLPLVQLKTSDNSMKIQRAKDTQFFNFFYTFFGLFTGIYL